MILTKRKSENSVAILSLLLKNTGTKVSNHSIGKTLTKHPFYPSLFSVSECLVKWGVPHQAYRIDKQVFDKENLPYPFLAHIKDKKEDKFILINHIADGKVNFSDDTDLHQVIDEGELMKLWDGIVLVANKGEGEKNYISSVLEGFFDGLRWQFLAITLLFGVTLFIFNNQFSNAQIAIIGVKLTGTVLTVLLLIKSIDFNNPYIAKLCGADKKNGCNSILNSDEAKINSWLSWSELGAFYFIGTLSLSIFSQQNMFFVYIVNLCSLPFTIYSIIIQIQKKSFCTLCCSILLVLWMEALVMNVWERFDVNNFNLGELLFYTILPIVFWGFLKPFFRGYVEGLALSKDIKRFKYESGLFNAFLKSQGQTSIPENLVSLSFGDPFAETSIVMVSNLFCNPCAKAHKVLSGLLNEGKDFQLKIIFSVTANETDNRIKVLKHLRTLNLTLGKDIAHKALDDWYENKDDVEVWMRRYPCEDINEELHDLIRETKVWYENNNIMGTPTLYINDHELVAPYKLEDLEFLI